jgi:hypothetical protein
MPKLLILLGAALILLGSVWLIGEQFGLGRLPGDLKFEYGSFRVYIPLATSVILSVVLSLVLYFFRR